MSFWKTGENWDGFSALLAQPAVIIANRGEFVLIKTRFARPFISLKATKRLHRVFSKSWQSGGRRRRFGWRQEKWQIQAHPVSATQPKQMAGDYVK